MESPLIKEMLNNLTYAARFTTITKLLTALDIISVEKGYIEDFQILKQSIEKIKSPLTSPDGDEHNPPAPPSR